LAKAVRIHARMRRRIIAPRVALTMAMVGGVVVCFWVVVEDAGGMEVAVDVDVTVAVVLKVIVMRELCPFNRVVGTVPKTSFVVIQVGCVSV
jgi:hypothetical protein